MPKSPKPIDDTTFEVELFGGDKVEIGDKESADFQPHIKLNRWDGECWLAIKPAGEIEEEVEYEVEGDKIKCKYKVKQGEFEFELESEFYPLEPTTVIVKDKDGNDVEFPQNELGGFEFEIILKKKPVTNKIVLNIETQGLKFYPQPLVLDADSIAPDNVLGSIAVYHTTRTSMHRGKEDAEKYKCGKAFHIYRPKITDANGDWVWGVLSLDEQAGTLTTIIPQDFLDSAVYPVSTGTTNFGYETLGGVLAITHDRTMGGSYTGAAGTGVSMSAGVQNSGDPFKCALYEGADVTNADLVTNGITDGGVAPATKAFVTVNFTSAPTLSVQTYHLIIWLLDSWMNYAYDEVADLWWGWGDNESNGWPDPCNLGSLTGRRVSIYCTYTAGGVIHEGAVTFSGVGTLACIGRGIFVGKATLSGTGTLAAIGRLIAIGKVTFSGTGTLSAIGRLIASGKATLSGVGTLTAIGRLIAVGKATLSGVGTLSVIGTLISAAGQPYIARVQRIFGMKTWGANQ